MKATAAAISTDDADGSEDILREVLTVSADAGYTQDAIRFTSVSASTHLSVAASGDSVLIVAKSMDRCGGVGIIERGS